MPLHVSSRCAHHQEVKIALHSLWYHHTYRCGDTISEYGSDLEDKLQRYNKINGAIQNILENEQRNKVNNSQHYS